MHPSGGRTTFAKVSGKAKYNEKFAGRVRSGFSSPRPKNGGPGFCFDIAFRGGAINVSHFPMNREKNPVGVFGGPGPTGRRTCRNISNSPENAQSISKSKRALIKITWDPRQKGRRLGRAARDFRDFWWKGIMDANRGGARRAGISKRGSRVCGTSLAEPADQIARGRFHAGGVVVNLRPRTPAGQNGHGNDSLFAFCSNKIFEGGALAWGAPSGREIKKADPPILFIRETGAKDELPQSCSRKAPPYVDYFELPRRGAKNGFVDRGRESPPRR